VKHSIYLIFILTKHVLKIRKLIHIDIGLTKQM